MVVFELPQSIKIMGGNNFILEDLISIKSISVYVTFRLNV